MTSFDQENLNWGNYTPWCECVRQNKKRWAQKEKNEIMLESDEQRLVGIRMHIHFMCTYTSCALHAHTLHVSGFSVMGNCWFIVSHPMQSQVGFSIKFCFFFVLTVWVDFM